MTLYGRTRWATVARRISSVRMEDEMERVLGLGGVFFKCRDPKALQSWYERHLGIQAKDGYVMFRPGPPSKRMEATAWSPFKHDTDYFSPSEAPFMLNYRVRDLDAMLAQLRSADIELVGQPTSDDYGKFAWLMDPEGNKIELWEPPLEATEG